MLAVTADLGGIGGQGGIPGPREPLLRSRHPVRRQRVQVAGADAAVLDEPGVAQHPQVLAHCRAADRQPLGELPDRRRPVVQQLEDAAAYRLAEGLEDGIS